MPNTIGFSLESITTEQFAVIESAYNESEEVQFSIDSEQGINEEERMIAVFVSPSFLQNNTPFLVLKIACHFRITEEAWDSFINKNNTKLSIPVGFLRHLIMLSIGTARGILHSKTENSLFNKFLLPTINLTEVVTHGVSFDLNTKP